MDPVLDQSKAKPGPAVKSTDNGLKKSAVYNKSTRFTIYGG